MMQVKTILHPTDFSAHSAAAFQMACALARDYGAELILLHVKSPEVLYVESYLPAVEPLESRRALEDQLAQLRPADPTIRVSRRFEEGDAAGEIIRVAEETKCDLIVLATHGRRGIGRLLMGSVAEAVLRRAPCPVLTVKNPMEKATVPQEAVEVVPAKA